jgi:hypothetical protein
VSWSPPHGSVEVEPGYWQAPNGDLYESLEAAEAREAERAVAHKALDRERHDREVRQRSQVIDRLHARCEQLEVRAFLAEEAFAAAAQLLTEKQEELELEQGILEAVLAEHRPPVELRRVA